METFVQVLLAFIVADLVKTFPEVVKCRSYYILLHISQANSKNREHLCIV